MPKQLSWAISYAQNMLSFLFLDSSIENSIRQIYLYGSATRGELTAESDMDVFIDCEGGKEAEIERAAKASCSRFYRSLDYQKWTRLKFTHPFSIMAGQLEKWELHSSVLADGIIVYSREPSAPSKNRSILCTFTLPREKSIYLGLVRALYGRQEKGYRDRGLLGKINGEKLAANVVLIPREQKETLLDLLHRKKIDYTLREIYMLQ